MQGRHHLSATGFREVAWSLSSSQFGFRATGSAGLMVVLKDALLTACSQRQGARSFGAQKRLASSLDNLRRCPSNDPHVPSVKETPFSHSFRPGACCHHQYRPASQYRHLPHRGYPESPGIIHFSVSPAVQPVSGPFAPVLPFHFVCTPPDAYTTSTIACCSVARYRSAPSAQKWLYASNGGFCNTCRRCPTDYPNTTHNRLRGTTTSVAISTPTTIPRPSPSILPTSQLPSSDRTVFDDFATNALHVVDTETPSFSATLNYTGPNTQTSNPDLTAPQTSPLDGQRSEQPGSSKQKRQSNRGKAAVKKRRRKAKTPATDDEDAAPDPIPRRRRHKSSTAEEGEREIQPKKVRSPSLPRFDPDEGPGEELDPTVITMASLCSDTGQGRISSKASRSRKTTQIGERRELAELKKYGRLTEDGEEAPLPTLLRHRRSLVFNISRIAWRTRRRRGRVRLHSRLRIGPNGETIIDEESLVVDRAQDVDTSTYTHVVESDTSKFINSGTYRKKCRGSRWSKEETELFFNALSQYGENYELLAFVLPGRDRTAYISTLSRMTGRDFSGPCPEIRQPPPRLPPSAPVVSTEHEEHVQHKQPKHKKRSRSRSMALTDDVVVIGNADTFDPTDD
ncbi:Transcription factor TFIIIB component [Salix suchowensis]|nr:Transcription factor TFIIIB component [Salix suchowensis]